MVKSVLLCLAYHGSMIGGIATNDAPSWPGTKKGVSLHSCYPLGVTTTGAIFAAGRRVIFLGRAPDYRGRFGGGLFGARTQKLGAISAAGRRPPAGERFC